MSDGRRERALVLVDKLIVGRDPTCDVSHEDDLLSRRHAEFVAGADSVTVRDLGSRNGIFVNGLRSAERALFPGDVVQIGPIRILYAHDVSAGTIHPEQLIADRTVVLAQPPAAQAAPAPPPPVHIDEDRTPVWPPIAPTPRPVANTPSVPPLKPAPAAPPASSSLHDGPTQLIPPPSATREPARDAVPSTPRPWSPPPAPVPAPLEPAATLPLRGPITPLTPSVAPAPSPSAQASASADAAPARKAEMTAEPSWIASPGHPAGRALDSELKGYVFGQSTLLAIVVLLSTIVPLSVVRGEAVGFWLVVPVVITILMTYVVATFINRRFARIVRALMPDRP